MGVRCVGNFCIAKAAEKKLCKGKYGEKKSNQVLRKKSCTKAITYQNKKNHTEPKGAKNISGSRKLPHHHPTEIFPYLVFLPVWVSQTCAWCEAGLGEDQKYRFLSTESETKFLRIEVNDLNYSNHCRLPIKPWIQRKPAATAGKESAGKHVASVNHGKICRKRVQSAFMTCREELLSWLLLICE